MAAAVKSGGGDERSGGGESGGCGRGRAYMYDTSQAIADSHRDERDRLRPRALTPIERRGPFTTHRFAVVRPGGGVGHPAVGQPWCGVVSISSVKYRVHMPRALDDPDLFRLNSDVWRSNL